MNNPKKQPIFTLPPPKKPSTGTIKLQKAEKITPENPPIPHFPPVTTPLPSAEGIPISPPPPSLPEIPSDIDDEDSQESQTEIDNPLILNFTHQIIAPLNAVIGTIDNVIDGTIKEEKRQQKLKTVRAQLAMTIELVRNLAYLSQLTTQSGRESLRARLGIATIPLVAMHAVQFFQEPAEKRGVRISITDSTTQYKVRGHKDLLQQVFMNLLENALKYCDPDTEITIEIKPQKTTGNLIIDVINTGIGFNKEEISNIFKRGTRGKEAVKIKSSGSGIGLYICKNILKVAFNAKIEAIYATKLRQVTFRIRFPEYTIDKESTEKWRYEKDTR
ncbi:HAMP domain-containing sensor histidine kinase [Geothrix sp. 21YS21S-4]|uniref:sensor histidine kinase n=1 Tax=Geothrix sp. 21YS21S-4 TaxID=3068889 RepID=UPI0027B90DD3|nr:HAMP domain-containing sensor histidine kinase [Geothrix sp. 21YS21S-4]